MIRVEIPWYTEEAKEISAADMATATTKACNQILCNAALVRYWDAIGQVQHGNSFVTAKTRCFEAVGKGFDLAKAAIVASQLKTDLKTASVRYVSYKLEEEKRV